MLSEAQCLREYADRVVCSCPLVTWFVKGLARLTTCSRPWSPPRSGIIPNVLDDEVIGRPDARRSLRSTMDISKLVIWPYVPLFILADHYWLSVEPQAEVQLAWPDGYGDRKFGWGSQAEHTMPSHLAFSGFQVCIATTMGYSDPFDFCSSIDYIPLSNCLTLLY
jgi:hypothetical protein